MSASKWNYDPSCDGEPCIGDCDLCHREKYENISEEGLDEEDD